MRCIVRIDSVEETDQSDYAGLTEALKRWWLRTVQCITEQGLRGKETAEALKRRRDDLAFPMFTSTRHYRILVASSQERFCPENPGRSISERWKWVVEMSRQFLLKKTNFVESSTANRHPLSRGRLMYRELCEWKACLTPLLQPPRPILPWITNKVSEMNPRNRLSSPPFSAEAVFNIRLFMGDSLLRICHMCSPRDHVISSGTRIARHALCWHAQHHGPALEQQRPQDCPCTEAT